MQASHTVSLYLAFAHTAFNRQAAYRLANLAGTLTNTFFLLFRAAVFQAVFQHSQTIAGYTLTTTWAYIVLVQALVMVVPQWGTVGVAEDIRTGQVAMDLSRPVNYYGMVMAKRFGVSVFHLLARGVPVVGIGYLLGIWQPPDVPMSRWWYFAMSLSLSIFLANSIHFLVELTGFWLESSRGPKVVLMGVIYFLSGAVMPIAFFPDWARQIASWLPFAYTLNAPIEIALATTSVWSTMVAQALWVLILVAMCQFAFALGVRKITLHGG